MAPQIVDRIYDDESYDTNFNFTKLNVTKLNVTKQLDDTYFNFTDLLTGGVSFFILFLFQRRLIMHRAR